jgi:acetyl esterase/lipase
MVIAVIAAVTLLPVSAGAAPASGPALPVATADGARTSSYLPGLSAQVRVPAAGSAPLVVMIPGGAWATADPGALAPLAARLTQDGMTTSVLTYSTTGSGTRFPVAVNQVACGVRWSVQRATELGHPPTKVIVLGHSAGGQLAALVAFSGTAFGKGCRYPAVRIDGLVGMAGVYNTDWYTSWMRPWMGADPAAAPRKWKRVNPMFWLQERSRVNPTLQTLLIHGSLDPQVPYAQTTALADALRAKGMAIRGHEFVGLEHMTIIEAGVAEPPITSWLVGLGWLPDPHGRAAHPKVG